MIFPILLWLSWPVAPQALARGKEKGGATLRSKHPLAASSAVSPDRRHIAGVIRRQLFVDGRLRALGPVVGRPVWRSDSRALAFLRQGARRQLELLVIPDISGGDIIVWRVPALVGRHPRLAWLGRCTIGLGRKVLMPRVVFSWTTQLARH